MKAYRFPAFQWVSTGGTTRPTSKIAVRDLNPRLPSLPSLATQEPLARLRRPYDVNGFFH